MSAEAVTFAKRTALGEAEGFSARLLFYIVADNLSSETGTCVMGKTELALQMHASPSTVWRQALALEEAGFIRVIKRSNGRQRLPDEIEIVGFKDWWAKQGVISTPERPVDKPVDNKVKTPPTSQIEILENDPKPSNLSNCNIANCEDGHEILQPLKLQYCTGEKNIKESLDKKKEDSEVSKLVGDFSNTETPTKTKSKQDRGTRLRDDWFLPKPWGQWTAENFPSASAETIRIEAMKFANHWQSQPGAKAVKLDWYKTWQNWCINAFSRSLTRAPPLVPQRESASAVKHREGVELYERVKKQISGGKP